MAKLLRVRLAALTAVILMALLISACGGDDEVVPGVTDDAVILGTHQSLTGPVAVYSPIPNATEAYFDYINDTQGGVNGRKITYLIEDDAYSPPKTVDLVRKLVEQDNVFAIINGLGTPTHLQVVDYLQEAGVPDLFVATGASEWVRDPAKRTVTFGFIESYVAGSLVMGQHIIENYAGKKLGIILQNDDFGRDGTDGMKRATGTAVEIVGEETFEAVDSDLNSQVDRLQAAGADVIFVQGTPRLVSTALKHARLDLNWDVPFYISGVSANIFTIGLAGPEVAEGVISYAANRQFYETDDPGVAKHIEIMRDYGGTDQVNFLTITGQIAAELTVEALRLAGDDLTRETLLEAVESIKDFTCSVCLFPFSMDANDHDPSQGTCLVSATGGRWVRFGSQITWEGTTIDGISLGDLKKGPAC